MHDPMVLFIVFCMGVTVGEVLVVRFAARRIRKLVAKDMARLQAERDALNAEREKDIARQEAYRLEMMEFAALVNYGAYEDAIDHLKQANAKVKEQTP